MGLFIIFDFWLLLQYVLSEGTTTLAPEASSLRQVPKGEQSHKHRINPEIYECKTCGAHFDEWELLNSHVLRSHQTKPLYRCEICTKDYSTSWSLRFHLRSHMRKKLYPCSFCSRDFKSRGYLQDHMRLHKKGAGCFPCEICGAVFGSPAALYKHRGSHETPFLCSICNRRFIEQSEFRAHARIHEDEKIYSCDLCGRKIKHKVNLMLHMESHPEDWCFTYMNCGLRYRTEENFQRHMETHSETNDAAGRPSHLGHGERSETRPPSYYQGTHANQKLDQGYGTGSSRYGESPGGTVGASANPSTCTCSYRRDSEPGQESHCRFEQLFESHHSTIASDSDRVNAPRHSEMSGDMSGTSSDPGIDPRGTLICYQNSGVIQEDYQYISEQQFELNRGATESDGATGATEIDSTYSASCSTSLFNQRGGMMQDENALVEELVGIHDWSEIFSISSHLEFPNQLMRIAQEISSLPCTEDVRTSAEIQSIIDEIIRSHREAQSSDCGSEGPNQLPE